MNGRTRRKAIRKSRKIRKMTFVILTVLLVLGIATMVLGGQKKSTSVYYDSVRIHAGDTLWGIAQEYKGEHMDTETMIAEIMELNGMQNTAIQAGQSILVPVVQVDQAA